MMAYKNVINGLMDIFGKNLTSIVLFGSRARKNYNENSDIDLIVITDKYEERNLNRLRKFYLLNFDKRLDLHVFSKKDAIKNFDNFSQLFVTLLLGKKILFDKEMFFKKTFDNFIKKMRNENIKYCEEGKIWEMKKIAKNLEVSL